MFAQWRQHKRLHQTSAAWCLPLLASVGTEEQLKRAKTTELKMNVTTKPPRKRRMPALSPSLTVWTVATPDQGVIVGVIQHSATL